MNNKPYIFGAILVALLIAVIVFAATSRNHTEGPTASNDHNQVRGIAKAAVDKDQVPENFPTDIPIEADAVITQNYNAQTDSGFSQATRAFLTKATLEQNFSIYKTYLARADYHIANTIDKIGYKMVYGVKDNTTLQITISQNTLTKAKTVTISYTQLK